MEITRRATLAKRPRFLSCSPEMAVCHSSEALGSHVSPPTAPRGYPIAASVFLSPQMTPGGDQCEESPSWATDSKGDAKGMDRCGIDVRSWCASPVCSQLAGNGELWCYFNRGCGVRSVLTTARHGVVLKAAVKVREGASAAQQSHAGQRGSG